VQKAINIQAYFLNGSTSFRSNLKALKLREEDVKSLVKETVNKMVEYDSYSSESVRINKAIVKLQFETAGKWKLSTGEINYYISGGMALMEDLYNFIKEEK
jgi:CRISPR-associated protein Cas8b/Csh1 subtype I-B